MAQSIVTLSGNDAELYKAFQRIIEQQRKVDGGYDKLKASSREAARAAEIAARSEETSTRKRATSLNAAATSVAGLASSYLGLQTAISLVNTAFKEQSDRQERAIELQRTLAAAQQEAAKNLAGNTPAQISATLQKTVPELARSTGFADLPKLTTALGAAASIVGEKTARGVVEQSARLTKFTPDQLQTTATATADILSATGLKDSREGLSLLASTGSVARPEQLAKLATGAAVAINAAIGEAPKQDRIEAAREGVALYAKLSKVDPQGQSAATAAGQLLGQVSGVFTDTKTQRARAERIQGLIDSQPDSEIAIERAKLKLDEAKQKAGFVDAADSSSQANEIRLAVKAAEVALAGTQRRSAADSLELAGLQSIQAATAVDPGTFTGRLSAIRANPALSQSLSEGLTGEQKFLPLFRQLLDGTSEFSKDFETALSTVTTNVKAFEDVAQSTVETPQARRVAAENRANVAVQIASANDTDSLRKLISKISNNALSETSIDFSTGIGNAGQQAALIASENFDPIGMTGSTAQSILQERLDYLGDQRAPQDKIDVIVEALQAIQSLARMPETLEVVAKSGTAQEEYLRRQNELAEDTARILRNLENFRGYGPPAANAIQNQVKQERFLSNDFGLSTSAADIRPDW